MGPEIPQVTEQSGAAGFIRKPYRLKTLEDKVLPAVSGGRREPSAGREGTEP